MPPTSVDIPRFCSDVATLCKTKVFSVGGIERIHRRIIVESFEYKSPSLRLSGTTALLDLLSYLHIHLDEHFTQCAPKLVKLLSRKEFSVDFIKDQSLRPLLVQYRRHVEEILETVLRILETPVPVANTREFCTEVLAVSYFILPASSSFILSAMTFHRPTKLRHEHKLVLEALRKLIVSETLLPSTPVNEEISWESLSNANHDQELSVLSSDHAKALAARFAEEPVFYSFVRQFVLYCSHQYTDSVPWQKIHGYWTILRGFFDHILVVSPELSSRSQIECLRVLCKHHHPVLNLGLQCLLYNTNIYETKAVFSCIDILDLLLLEDSSDNTPLHRCIDIRVLVAAFTALLSSDEFQIVSKTLWLLFHLANRLYLPAREALLFHLLIRDNFFRLMLHWSYIVRRYFAFILVFRLRRRGYLYSYDTCVKYASIGNAPPDEEPFIESSSRVFKLFSSFSHGVASLWGSVTGDKEDTKESLVHPAKRDYLCHFIGDKYQCYISSIPRLSVSEMDLDEEMEREVNSMLAKITSGDVPDNLKVYADAALVEFHALVKERTEAQTMFSEGMDMLQVVTPDLPFSVAMMDSEF